MASESLRIILGFLLIGLSLSCGIVIGHYGAECYRMRDEMSMVKRHGNIVLLMIPLAMFNLIIGYPFSIFTNFEWPLAPIRGSETRMVMEIINDFLWNPPGYTFMLLTITRLWLMFYEIQFSNSVSNFKWKQMITSNMKKLRSEQWFIARRHDLGNKRYLMKWAFIISAVAATITIMFSYFSLFDVIEFRAYRVVSGVIFISATVLIVIMYWKIPHFYDHFFIHRELQLMSYVSCSAVIAYILNHIVPIVIGADEPNLVHDVIWFLVWIYSSFTVSFICSFWVLRQLRISGISTITIDIAVPLQMQKLQKISELYDNDLANTSFSIIKSRDSFRVPDTIEEMLKDDSFLNQFARHLTDELSIECLLSVIEMQQFKEHLIDSMKLEDASVKQTWFRFAPTVPKSDIVHRNEKNKTSCDLTSFRRKAFALYKKYVAEGSEFEVNVPAKLRLELFELIGDENKWINESTMTAAEVAKLFDDVMMEMLTLLQYSSLRFTEKAKSGELLER